jgi:hypothetical protein|tara:strand:- start:56 stop:352 length:297 start_codon:yes stop_codon:yes gene_type:complete
VLRPLCAKLTEEIVEEIYIELRGVETITAIALMFGVSRGLIDHINSGKAWPVRWYTYPIRKKEKKIALNYGGDPSHSFPLEDSYPCKPYDTQWNGSNL